MPPMSPMSWYGGSQITPTESRFRLNFRWITCELCKMFACVSVTPRGAAVDPEVYWRIATLSEVSDRGLNADASTPSVCEHRMSLPGSATSNERLVKSSMSRVVNMIEG